MSRADPFSARLKGVPKLGLGMAALGRPGYINLGHADDMPGERGVDEMRAHAHAVLDAAYELGLRYFDCARSYGLSEDFVASWLATRPDAAAAAICGSKWGYEYTANWRVNVGEGEAHEVKFHTPEQFEKQVAKSRALLPSMAVYQIHSATEASGVLDNAAVLARLAALRDGGVVAGLSVSHPQVPTIAKATALRDAGGAPIFGSVQATFNLLDQSAAGALRAAHDAGMVVIVKEALANGRLTARSDDARLKPLRDVATRLGVGIDAVALAWVMSQPFVDVCLSGAATVEQLKENAAALAITPLSDETMRLLADTMAIECEDYWAERRGLAWN